MASDGGDTTKSTMMRPKTDEIKLFDSSKERNRLEELSDLYAIIKATELLEAAYTRDAITSSEYTDACHRTISQFKTTEAALIHSKQIEKTEAFMKEFQIDCPRAYERLVVAGMKLNRSIINIFIHPTFLVRTSIQYPILPAQSATYVRHMVECFPLI